MPDRLSMADVANLLGLSRPRVWQLRKRPDFPKPAERDAGRDYYTETAILRWAAQAGREIQNRAPVLFKRPPAGTDSVFTRAVTSGGHVVLIWDVAQVGTVGLTYTPFNGSPDLRGRTLRKILVDVPELDSIVIVLELFDADGPELKAIDRQAPDRVYEPEWSDLVEIFGGPVPWWPKALRKPEELLRWHPGAAQVTTSPLDEVDVGVLLRAASDREAGSPVNIALTAFAREQRQLSRADVQRDLDLLSGFDALKDGRIQIAAVAAAGDETPADVPEVVRRAAWIDLLERTDTTSWSCVREKILWDGGKDFPYAYVAGFELEDDPTAAEWVRDLELAEEPLPAAFALFDADRVDAYYKDPRTGAPVVRYRYDAGYGAAVPTRLPAVAPLQELILGPEIWIRTADGQLYLAPRQRGAGISYGYGGGGPHTLARTLALILDDINAEASAGGGDINQGLLDLIALKWPAGTALTCWHLEKARAGD